jgi:hypothetical protein
MMTVVAFNPRREEDAGIWRHDELQQLVGIFAAHAKRGDASDWAVAATDIGDPQFYLLGRQPEQECVLCVSRIGARYVLTDGEGAVLAENVQLAAITDRAMAFVPQRQGYSLFMRLGAAWIAVRHHYHEKVEPVLAEPMELLTHFCPQIAAVV